MVSTFSKGNIDLIILDLGLPDGNGLTLCRKIRETSNVPIVMLTAQDLETEVAVSATEFRLLYYFMQNAGQILSKKQLLAALWDNAGNFVDENTLSVNISRLRSKIEIDPKKPQTIKTVHGLGYVWVKG